MAHHLQLGRHKGRRYFLLTSELMANTIPPVRLDITNIVNQPKAKVSASVFGTFTNARRRHKPLLSNQCHLTDGKHADCNYQRYNKR